MELINQVGETTNNHWGHVLHTETLKSQTKETRTFNLQCWKKTDKSENKGECKTLDQDGECTCTVGICEELFDLKQYSRNGNVQNNANLSAEEVRGAVGGEAIAGLSANQNS